MEIKNIDIFEIRKMFFHNLQDEYRSFKEYVMAQTIATVYNCCLKIAFYREVYRYLNDDVLNDEEYVEFAGENIIEKLWDIYVVSELPKQTRDYLRQLVKLHKENNSKERNKA